MVSKKDKIIDFIKKQISIDITQYIDLEYSTRKYLNLNWNEIPKNEQRQIQYLSLRYNKQFFELWDNGGLGMALVMK